MVPAVRFNSLQTDRLVMRRWQDGVLSWLDSLEVSDVVTTAVTTAELRYGVARLPDGHRERELTGVIRGLLGDGNRARQSLEAQL